ncbi:MAG TPA: LuxR C-terminal-related transcriptional regulator [Ktedonobacteraceae bacterium]|nr:LuxR C-terminal-related transcriptional regulator [Ktedonobacteraceae bacterium]
MARSTPTIEKSTLVAHAGEWALEIAVGSAAWFEWLERESSTLFAFRAPEGGYTARREGSGSGRGGWYWKAYRKHQGRLYRAYMGKAEDLTLERLGKIAQTLSVRIASEEREIEGNSGAARLAEREGGSNPVATPLLETRLRPPRLPTQLVERAHLLALLDDGRQRKLTLLHAPAGFGKTTLVSRWLARRQARAPTFMAWLSLEDGDNDPLRFWLVLIAAYQLSDKRIGQTALAQLSQSAHLPFAQSPLQTALTFLLNDLSHFIQEGVMVLEDYHLIEHAQIHETLAFFIEHLPTSLHVIILTRSLPPLPLVRWRARGDLLELQTTQLRFSLEETVLFLQQFLPQALTEEYLHTLYTQLEGWPAGLRLLALGLQSQTTPQAIEDALKQLSADSPAKRAHRPIQEFFLSEVLAAQPESLQLFLLQTSLLSRLSGSLCDALTGRHDGAEWLETVARSGFFLEALDSVGEWYRYHALFAEAMRAEAARRLGAGALRELSVLASHWYEEHAMLAEAIEAALFAQDFERTGLLIENLNEHAYFNEYHTTRHWLEQMPQTLLAAHPVLCFLLAQACIFTERQPGGVWRIESAEDLLQLAEKGWREQGDLLQVGILYAFRATFTIIHGRVMPAVTYARQALQILPANAEQAYQQRPAEWIEWHCGCLLTLGMEAMQTGAVALARQYLLAGYTLSLRVKDRVFTRVIGRMLGDVYLEMGELHQANSYYRQALAEPPWPDETGEEIFRAQIACGLIRLAYAWNELDRAEQLAREASHHHYQGDFPVGEETGRTQLELLRTLLLRACGKKVEAQVGISALIVHLQAAAHTHQLIPDVLLWQACAQIRDGALQAAERTLDTLTNSEQELSPLQHQSIHLLTARLLLAQGEAASALPLLEQLLRRAQEGQHVLRVLEIQLLSALAHASLKQGGESRQQLTLVLAQARGEDFLRLFLDEGEPVITLLRELLPSLTEKPLRAFAQRILRAFAHPFAPPVSTQDSPLLEPLSVQEQRVLTLLIAGRSNPEIAEELIISINTVKGHVKNLYRKLDVNNRVEAGAAARHLKLI